MRVSKLLLGALLIVALPGILPADTLVLKDGQAITGKFQGADRNTLRFLVQGQERQYQISEVSNIVFTPDSRETAASAQPSPATPRSAASADRETSTAPTMARDRDRMGSATASADSRSAAPQSTRTQPKLGVTIPAGTAITVRMVDEVDSEVNAMGETFRATLDKPLVVNGRTVAPRGSEVTTRLVEVEQAGRIQGRSELALDLQDIVINGQRYEIATTEVSQSGASRGKQSAKVIGGTAALGAIIGAIAGGGKGAAIGATTGAGAGTAIQVMTRGEQVKVPPETRLEFTLESALQL